MNNQIKLERLKKNFEFKLSVLDELLYILRYSHKSKNLYSPDFFKIHSEFAIQCPLCFRNLSFAEVELTKYGHVKISLWCDNEEEECFSIDDLEEHVLKILDWTIETNGATEVNIEEIVKHEYARHFLTTIIAVGEILKEEFKNEKTINLNIN